jgi:hypothetical protein
MDSKRVSFQPQLLEDFAEQIRQEAENMPSNFNLSNRNIARLPTEIGIMTTLERFGLNNNRLVTLPQEMINLANLRHLNLHNNCFREFPSVLFKMKGLEVLDISNNKIKRFPPDFGELMNLRVLSVSQNRLAQLPKYLALMIKLRVLKLGILLTYLDGNPLTWPPTEFIQADDEGDEEIWLNNLKDFLSSNGNQRFHKDPSLPEAALFTDLSSPTPFGFRTESPISVNSLRKSKGSEISVFDFENIQSLSPTKVSRPAGQTCHQLLHSFLATYQHLLSPLTKRYPYLDPYVTILYACVELFKICGYLCDVIEKASKSFTSFDPERIHTGMSNVNLGALLLLKLLKAFLSCAVLDSVQINSLKSHMITLANESSMMLKSVLEDAIILVSAPNRPLDSRILTSLMAEWSSVNESLHGGISKISGSSPSSIVKRTPAGHSHSSSLNSLSQKPINSMEIGPRDQFRKIHATLIEMSNLGVSGNTKQLIVRSLQYCLNQDAMKLLDNLIVLLFGVKNQENVNMDQSAAELAAEAQDLLSLLSSA